MTATPTTCILCKLPLDECPWRGVVAQHDVVTVEGETLPRDLAYRGSDGRWWAVDTCCACQRPDAECNCAEPSPMDWPALNRLAARRARVAALAEARIAAANIAERGAA